MWFAYALLSGAFYSATGVITRYVLKKDKDAWVFSFYFSAVGAFISFPFLISVSKFSSDYRLWLLLVFVGGLVVVHNLLNFTAAKYLEAYVKGETEKLR